MKKRAGSPVIAMPRDRIVGLAGRACGGESLQPDGENGGAALPGDRQLPTMNRSRSKAGTMRTGQFQRFSTPSLGVRIMVPSSDAPAECCQGCSRIRTED